MAALSSPFKFSQGAETVDGKRRIAEINCNGTVASGGKNRYISGRRDLNAFSVTWIPSVADTAAVKDNLRIHQSKKMFLRDDLRNRAGGHQNSAGKLPA